MKGDYNMDLNKSSIAQIETPEAAMFGRCWCLALCLVFTEKRHSDLLAAMHSVSAN